jgi:ribonucleoside-diphosphate reductase alpha chain
MSDVEVPASWSYGASETLVTHFFRRTGVPKILKAVPEEGVPQWLWRHEADDGAMRAMGESEFTCGETSAKQLFHRLAGAWTYHGWKAGYFDTDADARAFYEEWCHMLAAQIVMPHGPQWLSAGLYWAYGLRGAPQGHVYLDEQGRLKRSFTAYE